MKALVVDEKSLALSDSLPKPTPGPGQVLVQVRAAGLNPSDPLIASGSLDSLCDKAVRSAPVRTGLEFAGVIVEGDDSLRQGQAVYGYPEFLGAQKTHQEYLVVDEDCVGPMPGGVSFVEAATLPVAAVTVLVAHRDVAPISPGNRVLVIGAAGGVGLINLQVAKRVHHAHVTAIAGAVSEELLVSMGADRVIDYRRTDLADLSERYDVIMDWTTNYRFTEIAHLLTERGRFVPADPFKNAADFEEGSEAASKTGYLLATKATRTDLATISEWVEAGVVRPIVDSVFPLDQHEQALRRLEVRAKRGRVVLQLDPEQIS